MAVGIETDRGLWVTALRATGYSVYAINPRQVARYRERHGTSGAKSDKADAHTMADMVRTDAHQLRPVAGDSTEAEAIKVAARTHQTLIWERTRRVQRLRHQLREYFPAALEAFEELDAPDTLDLLAMAPGPVQAAKLTRRKWRLRSSAPAVATSPARPTPSWPRCAASNCSSRSRLGPPTPPLSAP